jgi:hypothetical protein
VAFGLLSHRTGHLRWPVTRAPVPATARGRPAPWGGASRRPGGVGHGIGLFRNLRSRPAPPPGRPKNTAACLRDLPSVRLREAGAEASPCGPKPFGRRVVRRRQVRWPGGGAGR